MFKEWEFKQRCSLPLEQKVRFSEHKIKQWYDYHEGQVYISFSGGLDSTVLLHIVREFLGDDIPALFVDTGLEYPEIKKFVKEHINVDIITPNMNFTEVINTYGYPVISKEQSRYISDIKNSTDKAREKRLSPTGAFRLSNKWYFMLDAPFKISNRCCDVMKKNPAKRYERKTKRKAITGVRSAESNLRKTTYMKNGCNGFNLKRPISTPLAIWSKQDILEYIVKYNVPYCSVYGEILRDKDGKLYLTGEQSTGCVFCCFGVHKENHPNRFERMSITHPALFNYCMNKLNLKEVLEYMGVEVNV